MDDKELYEILKKYAEDTKCEKESAFEKLREESQEEVRRPRKRFKPRYVFAAAICVIVIVLCIALPITLIDKPQDAIEPTYCESIDIEYRMEDSLSVVVNNYHINALFPSNDADSVVSISSKIDSSLHGVQLGYVIEKNGMIFIELTIIPKTHILRSYENYISLQNELKWEIYNIKFSKEYDEETLMNNMKIYFNDGKYDYFIAVESDEEIEPTNILDILYS